LAEWIHMRAEEDPAGVLVSAHSQGTALSFIALSKLCGSVGAAGSASAAADAAVLKKIAFLTYGSHLNGLYALAFPCHFGKERFDAVAACLCDWRNMWRRTDPIGGPVFIGTPYRGDRSLGDNVAPDVVLPDPAERPSRPAATDPASPLAPLERDRVPWLALAVHSHYLAEADLKDWVVQRKADGGCGGDEGGGGGPTEQETLVELLAATVADAIELAQYLDEAGDGFPLDPGF
jgi:hypothetical protein